MRSLFFVGLLLFVFFLSVATSQAAFATTDALVREFSCVVSSENKKFDDIFLLQLGGNGSNSLSYQRRTINGYSELKVVDGCQNLLPHPQTHRPELLSFECDNDGEDGFIEIDPSTGVGEIYFYKKKIGYGERIELKISCTEK